MRLIAQSPILGTTITLNRLKQRGYIAMSELYQIATPNKRGVLFPII